MWRDYRLRTVREIANAALSDLSKGFRGKDGDGHKDEGGGRNAAPIKEKRSNRTQESTPDLFNSLPGFCQAPAARRKISVEGSRMKAPAASATP